MKEKFNLINKQAIKYSMLLDEGLTYWVTSLFHWFFVDIAFTLLPIVIIVFVKRFTAQEMNFLYLSPEWSFATIVSFGAAITGTIELKAEYQRDLSPRIYILTRMIMILLIFSVLTLALVVLRSENLKVVSDEYLYASQQSLLLASITLLLVVHLAKEDVKRQRRSLPKTMYAIRYYDAIDDSIKTANDNISWAILALSKRRDMYFNEGQPLNIVKNNDRILDVIHFIQKLEKNILELSKYKDELMNKHQEVE